MLTKRVELIIFGIKSQSACWIFPGLGGLLLLLCVVGVGFGLPRRIVVVGAVGYWCGDDSIYFGDCS